MNFSAYGMGIILLALLFFGCGESRKDGETQARSLSNEAENLWRTGKERQALLLYDTIAMEYPETTVAKNLEKELPLRNIMYGSAAESWTNMKLFDIENRLIDIYRETGEFPGALETGTDAWGMRIVYRPAKSKDVDFDFMVISAGPDKRFETGDDLRLVHARDPGLKPGTGRAGSGGRGVPAGEVALNDLDKNLDAPSAEIVDEKIRVKDIERNLRKDKGGKGKAGSEEKEIDLNDLLNNNP